MRYLDFRDVTATNGIYEMIYDGMHGAGGYSGPAEIRLLDRLLNKLETVGEPSREIAPTYRGYSLKTGGGIVALEDTEYNLMKNKIDTVQWVALNRARVVKMYDFIEGAPTTPILEVG